MRRFFWILLALFISVLIGVKVSQDPGYALFVYQQWSVSMPLWFAILTMVLFIFIMYLAIRFFDQLEMMGWRWKNWLSSHRKYKAYSKTNRGVIELLEGKWRSAEYYFLEGAKQSDAPLINYLGAAKAAQEENAFDKCHLYLQKAHQLMPTAEVAIGLAEAQFQINQGRLEQALVTLTELQRIAPKHKLVLKLLERVYIRLSDWNGLLGLLPVLRKTKLIPNEQLENFENHIYQELFKEKTIKINSVKALYAVWKTIPAPIQKNPEMILCYVKKLLQFSDTAAEVETLLTTILKKTWNEEAVYLYGLTMTAQPKNQLTRAESWLKQYGYHSVLFLTLGRLCVRCQLWGKAHSYFEQSLKTDPRAETYLEYGKLLEQLGEPAAALENYRQGLEVNTGVTGGIVGATGGRPVIPA